MKKMKNRSSSAVSDILDIAVNNHSQFKNLVEKLKEAEVEINNVFKTDLNKRIETILAKNPNNKNIQELVNLTQNVNQKHKFDHQARVIFATEEIKKFKPSFALDLRHDFEILDGRFHWKKDIKDVL